MASTVHQTFVTRCEHCHLYAKHGDDPCRACYWPDGNPSPNVTIASRLKATLEARYQEATKDASNRKADNALDLARTIGNTTAPIMAVSLSFAIGFFTEDHPLYAPYARQVNAGTRAAASYENDKNRRIADTALYGRHGADMAFAALSANGRGVQAWGDIHLEFSEETIAYRATVLEENSFTLIQQHRGSPFDLEDFIAGKVSTWQDRGLLVAVKLNPKLSEGMTEQDIQAMIIVNENLRSTAQFFEVHIFGAFNNQAIKTVRASRKNYSADENNHFLEGLIILLGKKSIKVEVDE